MSFIASQKVFSAAILTATVEVEPQLTRGAARAVLALDYTGFSGTIDIQGKGGDDDESWANVEYALEAATPAVAIAQLSETTTTAQQRYNIINPPARLRIVMTRSVGTIATGVISTYSTPAVLS